MRKVDLQQQATMLIKQLSTEKTQKRLLIILLIFRVKTQTNSITYISSPRDSREGGLENVLSISFFKQIGGVELEIPPREPMREPPRF